MNNKYILLSTTENPTYLEFLPSVCEMWRHTYKYKVVLGIITNRDKDDDLIKEIESYVDELYIQPLPDDNINICSQALGKLYRYYLGKYHRNDICIVMDIDLYVIDMKYFRLIDKCEQLILDYSKILTLGSNMYKHLHIAKYKNTKRYPIPGMACKGEQLVRLLDLNIYTDYINSIKRFCYETEGGIIKNIYGNESVKNLPFSDEALLVQIIENKRMYKDMVNIDRFPISKTGHSLRRLDRNLHAHVNEKFIVESIRKGQVEDVWPPRPLNINWLNPVLDHLKINKNKRTLKNLNKERIGILGIKNEKAKQLFDELSKKGKYVSFADPINGIGELRDILGSNVIYVYDYHKNKNTNIINFLTGYAKKKNIKIILN